MTYDYIIIGAGSAGCVLANRLSADPNTSVLLLEAGGKDSKLEIGVPAGYIKLHRSEVDWGFWTEPQEHVDGRKIYLPRGKTLGGSSSTNAMAYIRGHREDYNDWAAAGNEGWDYDSLLPYFIGAENNARLGKTDPQYHGSSGPLCVSDALYRTPVSRPFVDACKSVGIPETTDFNGEEQEGAGFFQFTIRNGQRHSTAAAYLRPALSRPNLTVITGALTEKIVLDNKRATGVRFSTSAAANQAATARREVIVSAGSFASPQLLMLSGIGDGDALRQHGIAVQHDLPGVGQNLQDHLFLPVSAATNVLTSNYEAQPWPQLLGLIRYFFTKTGPMTIGPLEANAFVKTWPGLQQPDLQLHFAPLLCEEGTDFHDIKRIPKNSGFTILPTLLKPYSRGFVGLHSADPTAAPLIQPNFLSDVRDLDLLVKGVKLALRLVESPAFDRVRKQISVPVDRSSDEALAAHIRRTVETVYHPVGTCKMGSDPMAVVDSQLRVHGLSGLRVVDASIMPTIVSGNTNAPVIAIAEKAFSLITA